MLRAITTPPLRQRGTGTAQRAADITLVRSLATIMAAAVAAITTVAAEEAITEAVGAGVTGVAALEVEAGVAALEVEAGVAALEVEAADTESAQTSRRLAETSHEKSRPVDDPAEQRPSGPRGQHSVGQVLSPQRAVAAERYRLCAASGLAAAVRSCHSHHNTQIPRADGRQVRAMARHVK